MSGDAKRLIISLCATLAGLAPAARAQDCNGNGTPDSEEVSVRLVFAPPERFTVGDNPTTIVAADVNGDDRLDLLVTNTGSSAISIFVNNGSDSKPRFAKRQDLCAGVDPRGIAVGDLNRDGFVDIVSGAEGNSSEDPLTRVHIFFGTQAGTFEPTCPPPCIPALPPACAHADRIAFDRLADAVRMVLLHDLDSDGHLDIVAALRDDDSFVTVLFNDQQGDFHDAVALNRSPLRESRYAAVGDIDQNGHPDVLTAGGQALLQHFEDGNARPFTTLDVFAFDPDPKGVAIGDVNGDGTQDVVVTRSAPVLTGRGGGRVRVFLNDGTGDLTRVPQPDLEDLCDLLESVAVADITGDGRADIVLTIAGLAPEDDCPSPGLQILVGDGSGRFTPGPFISFPVRRPRWVTTGDFDGDGKLDLTVALDAWTQLEDQVAVILNRTVQPAGDANANGVPDGCEFFRGDVDGDLKLTIADAIGILNHLFGGGPRPTCLETADVDNSATVRLNDAIALLNFLFAGAPPPEPPRPHSPPRCEWTEPWIDTNGILPCVYECFL